MDGEFSTMSPCMLISSLFLLGTSYGIVAGTLVRDRIQGL